MGYQILFEGANPDSQVMLVQNSHFLRNGSSYSRQTEIRLEHLKGKREPSAGYEDSKALSLDKFDAHCADAVKYRADVSMTPIHLESRFT